MSQLFDSHRTATDRTEAAAQALTAGLDVELPALDCYRELPGARAHRTSGRRRNRHRGRARARAEIAARTVRTAVRRAGARDRGVRHRGAARPGAPSGREVGVPPGQRRGPAAASVGAPERRGHRSARRRSPAVAGRLPLPGARRDHVRERARDRRSSRPDHCTRTGSCDRRPGRRELVPPGAVLDPARDATCRSPSRTRAARDGRPCTRLSRLGSRR